MKKSFKILFTMVKKNRKKILIIGNGQHAKVVGSMIIDENDYNLIGVLGSGIKIHI